MIDSCILARLVALGRAKEHLTNQDLQAALPIDTMGAEDIALIVVHLEGTGVPVELQWARHCRPLRDPAGAIRTNPSDAAHELLQPSEYHS